jgi:hypothetical protein
MEEKMKFELSYFEFNFLRKYLKEKIEQQEWILNNKTDIKDKNTLLDNLSNLKTIAKKLEKDKSGFDLEE